MLEKIKSYLFPEKPSCDCEYSLNKDFIQLLQNWRQSADLNIRSFSLEIHDMDKRLRALEIKQPDNDTSLRDELTKELDRASKTHLYLPERFVGKKSFTIGQLEEIARFNGYAHCGIKLK